MFAKLKDQWQFLRRAEPGERFQRYHRHRQDRRRNHALRILLLGGGVLVTLLGLVLMPAPGPGSVVVVAGVCIIAGESIQVARLLDRAELGIRKLLSRFQRRKTASS